MAGRAAGAGAASAEGVGEGSTADLSAAGDGGAGSAARGVRGSAATWKIGKPSGVVARTASAGFRTGAVKTRAGCEGSSHTTTGCACAAGLTAGAPISLGKKAQPVRLDKARPDNKLERARVFMLIKPFYGIGRNINAHRNCWEGLWHRRRRDSEK
jgi:hypothetical protein